MDNAIYFKDVIHMADEKGAYCNAQGGGDLTNTDADKLTCNKCRKVLEGGPDLLAKRREKAAKAAKALEPVKSVESVEAISDEGEEG